MIEKKVMKVTLKPDSPTVTYLQSIIAPRNYYHGASLSKQNTDLLNKAGFVMHKYTSRYHKTKANSQDSYCQCAYIRMN